MENTWIQSFLNTVDQNHLLNTFCSCFLDFTSQNLGALCVISSFSTNSCPDSLACSQTTNEIILYFLSLMKFRSLLNSLKEFFLANVTKQHWNERDMSVKARVCLASIPYDLTSQRISNWLSKYHNLLICIGQITIFWKPGCHFCNDNLCSWRKIKYQAHCASLQMYKELHRCNLATYPPSTHITLEAKWNSPLSMTQGHRVRK